MKKLLFITFIYILVPSFFVFNFCVSKNVIIKKENSDVLVVDNVNIKVKQVSKDKIISVDLEEYVKGVVAGEMPITFNKEALKAQAVAARTYALRRIKDGNLYDVVDTTLNQVYLDDNDLRNNWKENYEIYIKKLNEVIDETRGEYVSYNGYYADTLFFSTSTGNTENSEDVFGNRIEYLRSVPSFWDEYTSPVYEEDNYFSKDEFCSTLDIACDDIVISSIDTTKTGRVKSIVINDKVFSGNDIQYKLGIRSNCFVISLRGDEVLVTTKGFGHGVGMSQYGAEGMGNNGYTYKEILLYYYKGTSIDKL